VEFQPWPKTPRLFRDVVITEKIDGTNAAIVIEPLSENLENVICVVGYPDGEGELWVQIGAQSRKRLLKPGDDNFGFAGWVLDNAETLVADLGPGRHFGEWWGQGIQRGYGLNERRFSLFNTGKWAGERESGFKTSQLTVVPVLYEGVFNEFAVPFALSRLTVEGSHAAPGFNQPEGICVFHTQSRRVYKVTFDGDGHKNA
jgi:hypothetical protein